MPQDLKVEQMTEVLGLADHYTLDGLKNMCENILIHSVDNENVCHLLKQVFWILWNPSTYL